MTSVVPKSLKSFLGFSPCNMSIPARNAAPESVELNKRTFFVSSKTSQGRAILQTERMALLLIDVLRSYITRFTIHDFVVMPNHVHLLITVDKNMTIEKAVQLVKGNFSYRARKELGFQHEIWQKGFSEIRIDDRTSFIKHKEYIWRNPVKAGLAGTPEDYPFGSTYLRKRKTAAKAGRG